MARADQTVERWKELAEAARFNANALAKLCGVSIRQLQREFRQQLGRSPQDWLDERRIISARQLLLAGWRVKAVAFELGFKQHSHFCRHFKEVHGVSPSRFVEDYARQQELPLTDKELSLTDKLPALKDCSA